MSVDALIRKYAARGVSFALADDGNLRLTADLGVLDDQARSELRERKAEIVLWLQKATDSPQPDAAPALTRRARTDNSAPMSHAQKRLWLLDQIQPASGAHTIHSAVLINEALDPTALHQAVAKIVQRHQVLRTRFEKADGLARQIISEQAAFDWQVEHLDQSIGDSEAELHALLDEQACRGFDLQRGPLLRVRLYQLHDGRQVLFLCMHHIVGDGWSNGIFLSELAHYYEQARSGSAEELPALSVDYADYAQWQAEYLNTATVERLLGYWKGQLADYQPLRLPLDRPRPAVANGAGALHKFTLPAALATALRDLARSRRSTAFAVMMAAFLLLMRRYSGQRDIVVGTDVANRNRRALEDLIGFFVNQLVVRADLGDRPPFSELVDRVHSTLLDAYAHQDLPFDLLVEQLAAEHESTLSPFFQVKFIMQNAPTAAGPDESQRLFEPLELAHPFAKFDMTWSVSEEAQGYLVEVEYSTELFDPATIEALAEHYRSLLAAACTDPQQRIDCYALADVQRRSDVVGNEPESQQSGPAPIALAQMVESRAPGGSESIAVIEAGRALSYADLNQQANRLAHHLIDDYQVDAEFKVGICMPASIDYVTAVLAVSKAGGVAVPIDPTYPEQRIGQIIEDGELGLVIATAASANRLPAFEMNFIDLICIDEEGDSWADCSADNPGLPVHPAQLAYMVFTSGTTGRPKGVMVSVAGLRNLAATHAQRFGCGPGSRVLAFASVGFDASMWELVMALGTGATLVCAPRETIMPGADLAQFLNVHQITHLTLPPSALAVAPQGLTDSLQVLVLAGEACKHEVAKRWASKTRLFNAYGPSETTVCATMQELDPSSGGAPGSIGQSIDGCAAYVLDGDDQTAPAGVPGELCIAGAAVGRGYNADPRRSAERFVPDPYSKAPGQRMYRSGDRVRRHSDGHIEFLGRVDGQIKLRGHRIEIAEIEAQLLAQQGINDALVVLSEDEPKQLHAYLVAEQPLADAASLRAALRRQMPEYMIPHTYTAIERIPTTLNGKIDTTALPPPTLSQAAWQLPTDPTQLRLLEIWRTVTKVEQIGAESNFFDVGGTSLGLVEVQELLEQSGWQVSVADLFKYPTIASLAEFLGSADLGGQAQQPAQDGRIEQRRQALRAKANRRGARALETGDV